MMQRRLLCRFTRKVIAMVSAIGTGLHICSGRLATTYAHQVSPFGTRRSAGHLIFHKLKREDMNVEPSVCGRNPAEWSLTHIGLHSV